MAALSRRQLAVYGADRLIDSKNLDTLAAELAAVLVATRRQNQAELLASNIGWELEARGQVANAQLTSARALSESLRQQISVHIKKAAKVGDVIISQEIDDSLIGGVRIETAAHSWDKTIKRKLTDIREAF